MGGSNMQGNDFRVQDAEYRNGSIWMSQTIGCNPGGGTVNCVRWAEIDPTGPSVVQAGTISSDNVYRQFSDLGVNDCNDVVMGYTISSATSFPSVTYSYRLGSTTAGTMAAEGGILRAGELFTSFDSVPFRWGDYTGGTSDPDGSRLWYTGEYSRDQASASRWATNTTEFMTTCAATGGDSIFSDGFESGDTTAWTASVQ